MPEDTGIRRPLGPCLVTLAHACEDAIIAWDTTAACILWNQGAERLTGRSAADAIGRPVREIVPVDDPVHVDECVRLTLRGEEVADTQREFRLPHGGRGVLRARCSTLRDPSGSLIGGIAVLHDLTPAYVAETERAARATSDATRQAVFDAAFDAIVVVGPEGRYVDANRAACELLGRTRDDVLRCRVGDFGAPGHDGAGAFLRALTTDPRGFHRIARPDGSVRDIEFEVRAHFVPGLHLSVFRDVTERLALEAARTAALEAANAARSEEAKANAQHRRLARSVTELLERVRREIARELHDEVGQELTALRILLEAGAQPGATNGAGLISVASERVVGLIQRVRDLSFSLRPPMLDDLGLVAAVAWSAKRLSDATGIRVDFHQVGADRRFAPAVEVAAYRIAQESLTNVARHSCADRARVRIWLRGTTLYIEVADAGRGFDVEAIGESAGIAGMRERADLIGGTVTIESAPGQGTVVTAALPVGDEA